jgi:hypothetical protein
MQVVGFWEVFLTGAGGGVVLELLRWWKLRYSPQLPAYSRSGFYWFVTLTMIIAGGALAVLNGFDQALSAFTVLNIGASAPALIGALASEPPTRNVRTTRTPKDEPKPPELRQFLSFR